jgi:pimeloyl-ACP methyl ester carboxylesterase
MATVMETHKPRIHTVNGGGGLRLHVREWGPPDAPPIVLVHGWSQCHLCWSRQYESALAGEFRLVAFDLRGHGMSEAPLEARHYDDGRLWADDLRAVIGQLGLERAVLVGWSYGGFVICDHVRAHGQEGIAGIVLVEGAVKLGASAFGTLIGPGFLDQFGDATSDDQATAIQGLRRFLAACPATPLPPDVRETALAWNAMVPSTVRAHLGARQIDEDDVLQALEVPVLVVQGLADTVVLPRMAEHVLATCPTADASWYEGCGHVPHIEQPDRFNRELAAFARRVRG